MAAQTDCVYVLCVYDQFSLQALPLASRTLLERLLVVVEKLAQTEDNPKDAMLRIAQRFGRVLSRKVLPTRSFLASVCLF
jgi:hypothetical protein